MEQLAVSVKEAAKALDISDPTAYRLVRAGVIPVVKIGGRWRVPLRELHRLLEVDTSASA